MNFKQSVKLLNKISKGEVFYDVYERVKNYEAPIKIKTPISMIERTVSSYRIEFETELNKFIAANINKRKHRAMYDLISALSPSKISPFLPFNRLRHITTRDDLLKLINEEILRVNQILAEIKKVYYTDLNTNSLLTKLQPLVVNYLNKINSLIELESKPSSAVFLPKGKEFMENAFDINLRKAFDLLGKVQLKYKELNITEYKELNLERNKISLIKNKGFDENNELPGIIKYLEMLYKELSSQS